jgi:hypothetical protein
MVLTPRGAYGLRLTDVDAARDLLVDAPAGWIEFRIRARVGTVSDDHERMSDWEALLKLRDGGGILVDRRAAEATFVLPRSLRIDELVHPLLAPVAAVAAHWSSRESFHAGAVVIGGRAWGVIGARGAGKSTTMAHLALQGLPVLCDDLLVIDGQEALAGPRSIDLRREPAEQLGVGEALGVVGARERWRLRVAATDPAVELAGWIHLGWGERVESVRVAPGDRVRLLQQERGVRVPPRHPAALIELAALPTWELRRPRRLSALADAAKCLLQTTS